MRSPYRSFGSGSKIDWNECQPILKDNQEK
jgi:hypothetical protein